MKTKNNTSLFLQVLLCLIIFIFGYSICLRVLSQGKAMKDNSQDIYNAVYMSQNISERYRSGENIKNLLFDEDWNEAENISDAKFSINISENILTSMRLSDRTILCSWEVVP